MGKHKEKSRKHKKIKKHKKKERKLSSSSSSEEWVEKDNSKSSYNVINTTRPERDEWMNMSTNFYTLSNDCKISQEEKKRLEKEKNQYNPKESTRELNPYWKGDGDGLPKFKRPTDDNFEYKNNKLINSNWRKANQEIKSTITYSSDTVDKSSKEYSEPSNIELNKLAAKLVKAELMGNFDEVKELQSKLEESRKIYENSTKNIKDNDVLLTTTDIYGQSRPLKVKSAYGENSRTNNKKRKTETHNRSGERVRYFADDDKYSLKQMFENEKYEGIDKQNKEFLKMASKVKSDLDDIFLDEICKEESDNTINKKNIGKAISSHQLLSSRLDNCNYCLQSDKMWKHLLISMGETIYLSIPPFEPITEGHCFLVPLRHVPCSTQLDENEGLELLNFRRSLCKMFDSVNKNVVFFENVLDIHKYPHMVLECVPLSKEHGDLAPIYFKKAIDESETEWAMNKKLIPLKDRDVRRAVPKGLPYFSVFFGITDGYAHVIEDEKRFPKKFAQEIIGGMLDLDHSKWRKPKKEHFEQQSIRVQNFSKIWNNFDCTK